MRLATFQARGKERIGALAADNLLVDLKAAYESYLLSLGKPSKAGRSEALPRVPSCMVSFLRLGEEAFKAAEASLRYVEEAGFKVPGAVFNLGEVKLMAPIPRPPKIICCGLNYEDYRLLLNLPQPPIPLIFLKAPTAVIGPQDPIIIPKGHGSIFYEFELAAVIGRRCKGISSAGAYEAVAGYTIMADVTAHDIELKSREYMQWGKCIDTFAPLGPWITMKDQMPKEPHNLKITFRRNGKVISESNTRNMRWKIHEIIEFISTYITLEPGDIISTGSPPAGPIKHGDLAEAEVEGIGVLGNPVLEGEVTAKYAEAAGIK